MLRIEIVLSISGNKLVDAFTVRGCENFILGTCGDVISFGRCDDEKLSFELAGDRPIVRLLMFVVVAESGDLESVRVLFGGTAGNVVGV